MAEFNFDTIDNLLTGYVSGSLPVPLQVLVESHLELSARNRPLVACLEAEAGRALEAVSPVSLSKREAALDAIFSSDGPGEIALPSASGDGGMPRALHNFVGCSMDDVRWRTVMPGFREFDMPDVDGCHVSMFWIKPGRTVPAHTHEGFEISLVLQGAFVDERGRFGQGDISVADQSIDHRPTAENTCPCIGFAVTDAPVRLTGPLYQRIGDIIGAT